MDRTVSTAPSKSQSVSARSESSVGTPNTKYRIDSRQYSAQPPFSRPSDGVSRQSSSSNTDKSHNSHYPLDKYLRKDSLVDIPPMGNTNLKEYRSKQIGLYGTLNKLTKETERLKGPVLRHSVSDITANSVCDSESCYTEELVETQFRKATYAVRKKNSLDVRRKKSHFTIVSNNCGENGRVHHDGLRNTFFYPSESMSPGHVPTTCSPIARTELHPGPSFPIYQHPQSLSPRYEVIYTDRRLSDPAPATDAYHERTHGYQYIAKSPPASPGTPQIYDNYIPNVREIPRSSLSYRQTSPMPHPISSGGSATSSLRHVDPFPHRSPRTSLEAALADLNITSPSLRSTAAFVRRSSPRQIYTNEQVNNGNEHSPRMEDHQKIFIEIPHPPPQLHQPNFKEFQNTKQRDLQDVCVNTDFINSSVYNYKSDMGFEVKEESKTISKPFRVQQLPKLSIRPQLVTQCGPNINIRPQKVEKSKKNVGILEVIHPNGNVEKASFENKVEKLQNYQPKSTPKSGPGRYNRSGANFNRQAQVATPITPKTGDEPKLLRVAEEFSARLNSKKHQEFVDLKQSLDSLLGSVNNLYDNQLCTIEELKKVALGSKHTPEDLPRRMNMVAELLEDEIDKFGSQNMEHYDRLGRVMNILVDDIQTTLQAVDGQKNGVRPPHEIKFESKDKIDGELRRRVSLHNAIGQDGEIYPPSNHAFMDKGCHPRMYSADLERKTPDDGHYSIQKNLELRLTRIEKLFEINKSLKEMITEESTEDFQEIDEVPESYSSTGLDDTSCELEVIKSEDNIRENKTDIDMAIDEQLNETFM